MPGWYDDIYDDQHDAPPSSINGSLMSDGLATEQVKKFLFTSRRSPETGQHEDSLEIFIPEVSNYCHCLYTSLTMNNSNISEIFPLPPVLRIALRLFCL